MGFCNEHALFFEPVPPFFFGPPSFFFLLFFTRARIKRGLLAPMSTNAECASYVASPVVEEALPLFEHIAIDDVVLGGDGEEPLAELLAFFWEKGSVDNLRTLTSESQGDGSATSDHTQRGNVSVASDGVCLESVPNGGASAIKNAWSREDDIRRDLFDLNMSAHTLPADADWQHCSWKTFGDLHPSLSLDETFDWNFAEFAPAHPRLLVEAAQEAVAPENKAEDAEAGDAEMVDAEARDAEMVDAEMVDTKKGGAKVNAATDKKITVRRLPSSPPTASPTASLVVIDLTNDSESDSEVIDLTNKSESDSDSYSDYNPNDDAEMDEMR